MIDDLLLGELLEFEVLAAGDDGGRTLWKSVVAKMNTVCGGGSSSVLSRALNPGSVI